MFHFPPEQSALRPQIWQMTVWKGTIAAAQEGGVSVLLGDSWRFIGVPSKTTVRSLAAGTDGYLYFGDQGSIGRIFWSGTEVDVESIELPDSLRDRLGDVWGTHVLDSAVVFQARNHLIVDRQGKQDIYYSAQGFHNSFTYGGAVYVREFGKGLYRLDADSLKYLHGGSFLSEEMIFGITDYNGYGRIWTRAGNLYSLVGDSLVSIGRVSEELIEIAEEARPYTIGRIDSETYAIGSLGRGVIFVDEWGNILARFGAESGLPDDFINHVLVNTEGDIWFGLNNEGVARMELHPIKTRYGRQHGLWGHIYRIGEIDNALSLATGSRLSVLDSQSRNSVAYANSPSRSYFQQVPSTDLAWDFVNITERIFVATEGGAVLVSRRDNMQVECESYSMDEESVAKQVNLNVLTLSALHTTLLAGTSRGIYRVMTGHDEETDEPTCALYPVETGVSFSSVVKQVETHEEVVWVVTDDGQLYSGMYGDGRLPLTKYPYLADTGTRVEALKVTVGKATFVAQGHRLYRIHSPGLPPVELTNTWNPDHEDIQDIHADRENGIWLSTTERIVHYSEQGIRHTWPALEVPKGESAQMYVDKKGKLWYTDGDALVRFDPEAASAHERAVEEGSAVRRAQVFIQGVSTLGDNANADENPLPPVEEQFFIGKDTYDIGLLDYEFNSLKLTLGATGGEYLAPVYFSYNANDGEGWHEWTTDNQVELPSLSSGMHTISVRSRDDWGSISEPVNLTVHILPPWYATWWAMLLYFWGALALVYGGGRYVHMRRENRKAKEQKIELERNRVVMKKLEEANQSLTQANRMRDEFLATTSHELRTPMTAILGFTSILKEEIPPDAEYREFLDIIEESGDRLLDTLTSLLDLARLRADNMELSFEPVDLGEAAHAATSRFEAKATHKGIKLAVDVAAEPLVLPLDSYATGRTLDILLSNAIKFTDEGEVRVCLSRDTNPETGAPKAVIDVVDTGIGMDAAYMETLFEAYTQESVGLSRSHEGQGLGLAICAGLVELMNGRISVTSTKGEGSTFRISFPMDAPTSEDRTPAATGHGAPPDRQHITPDRGVRRLTLRGKWPVP